MTAHPTREDPCTSVPLEGVGGPTVLPRMKLGDTQWQGRIF